MVVASFRNHSPLESQQRVYEIPCCLESFFSFFEDDPSFYYENIFLRHFLIRAKVAEAVFRDQSLARYDLGADLVRLCCLRTYNPFPSIAYPLSILAL